MIFTDYYSFYDYAFLFDNNGNITSMSLIIPTSQAPSSLSSFLTERYQMFTLEGYTAGFINEKMDMIVGMTASSDFSDIFVIYMPFTGSKSTSANKIDISELEKLLDLNK